MIVVFEFLDPEPIHNVITNLNYKVDKTVFFGYADDIERQGKNLRAFLQKYCGGQTVDFIPVKKNNLKKIINVMRETVKKERAAGNMCFFDVTGGDDMSLVAFGALSTEMDAPMHVYNIEAGKLKEQNEGADDEISGMVPARCVEFDVEALVELMGGTVNSNERKSNKLLDDGESIDIARRLVEIFEENMRQWTILSRTFNKVVNYDGGGMLTIDDNIVSQWQLRMMYRLLKALADKGLIEKLEDKDGKRRYKVHSEFVYRNLIEEGAVLELRTCMKLKEKYRYVQAGVSIDWNGDTCESNNVENEVDVIALNGFIPVIVSCKAGKGVGKETLYELEAVADRFGGRYARKMLVTVHPLKPTTENRAEEMGIEVETLLGPQET